MFFRGPAFKFCGDNADQWRRLRARVLEGGMKSRLSSTIWTLVLLNGVIGFVVLGLAFSAGKKAGEASLFDFGSPAGGTVLFAIVLALATAGILAWRFGALRGPGQALAEFSRTLGAGGAPARAQVHSSGDSRAIPATIHCAR